jgi:uncharacterized protein YkwD
MLIHFCPLIIAFELFFGVEPAAEQNVEETRVLQPDPDAYDPEQTPELGEVAKKIVALTNDLRVEKELPRLKSDPKLEKTASMFADYMARTNRYGHLADGKDPAARVKEQDYEPCLIDENIAYAFRSIGFTTEQLAKEFFAGWKGSPGHLRNMLDPDVTESAVVVREGTAGYFFAVQIFGRPLSARVALTLTNESTAKFEYTLAERAFSLLPRETRIHQVCRPKDLEFVWQDSEKTDHQVLPEPDDHFVVTSDGENFQVRKK